MKKRIISFLLALMLLASLIPAAAITASAASKWTTSTNAINILTELQGFRDKPYQVGSKWYIGYGSEIASGDLYPNGISKEDALKLVRDYLTDTVDKAINEFTKKNNLDLTQNQHDALALYSYRTDIQWLTNSTHKLYQAVRTGKTGNDFINAIANANPLNLNNMDGLKAEMNLRLAEANMYLNNQYAYNRPSNMAYSVLAKDEFTTPYELVAYSTASGYALSCPTDVEEKNFLGWYVFDGFRDGFLNGAPIIYLTKDTDGKRIIAKIGTGEVYAQYEVNTSLLPSRAYFDTTYSRDTILYPYFMDEMKSGDLKDNTTFVVSREKMVDGVKWIYGEGKNTKNATVKGWVYLGELYTENAPTTKPIATATVTSATLNIREGATVGSNPLGILTKGTTVNIYEVKVEQTETGNQTWGKISVTLSGKTVTGWINLAYTDVKETSGSTDSAEGKTGKIVNTEKVNVRKEAKIAFGNVVTTLDKGTKVTVLETVMNGSAQWGKVRWSGLKDGYTEGWVYMYYVELDDAPHSNPGNGGASAGNVLYTGVVTSNINLNVRNKPDVYGTKVGSLPKDTKINIYEVADSKGAKWGRIGENQWVCLTYVKLTAVSGSGSNGSTSTTEIQATVTSSTLDVMKSYNNNSQKIGTLRKGDVVTILERNTENTGTGTRIWGRFIKGDLEGWINLAYADVKTVTNITNPDNGGNSGNTSNGNANGADAFIANCMAVNVREAAGTSSKQLLKLNNGTPVKIYEKVTKDNAPWARITWNNGASEGWVCMYYVEMKTATNGGNGSNIGNTNSNTISAVGTVNSNIALNVRAGAGLGYGKIGTLGNGTKVTVYEQVSADGMIWGRILYGNGSGWVCMSYINVDASSSTGKGVMGTIARCFKAVNVRSAPGTNNALVATINVGSRVEVFEQKLYSNQYWGRVAQGWICMDYVLLDSELPPGVIMDETKPTTETTKATEPTETINRDNEVLYTINGTVNASEGLNVRNDASSSSLKVGTINNNLPLKVLAVKSNNAELWGRIDQYATAGWVNMAYVDYSVHGYVNTDDQPIYADPNTGSTVKGTLPLNRELTIEKLTVNGGTVYGWVEEGLQGWIPMGRVSDEQQEIPVYQSSTDPIDSAKDAIGTTNASIDAVDAVNSGKVVFRLKPGVKVYIGEIRLEAGYVWGQVKASGVIGWIKLNSVTYVVPATVNAADGLNVRKAKDTTDEDNILGKLANGINITICELSFDSNGNLWGKLSSADAALNGGYVSMDYVTVGILKK